MNQDEINALFALGASSPVVKFASKGDSITGIVTGVDQVQQTTLEGTPKTYDDGNPMMQVVVTLAIETDDEDDPGLRRLFLKGAKSNPTSAFGSVCAALSETGSELGIGGTLTMTYVSDGQPAKRGYSPPKEYSAVYVPAR